MLFDDWEALERTLVVGVLAYLALVLLLLASGKRTLSKWNAFDFIVTIALGSSLASTLISKEVALAQGVVGFALLIALQFIVTWLSVRSPFVRRLVKARPTLLLYRGRLQQAAMKRQRVTEEEVRAALRARGLAALEQAQAVVLETDGSFSIITAAGGGESTLKDVEGFADGAQAWGGQQEER